MRKIVHQLVNSAGVRQSLITVFGNTFATGLSAISLIIISRLLDLAEFGEFSVGFAVVMILNRINDAGLNAAILKHASAASDEHQQTNNIFSYTLRFKLILSAFLILCGLLLTPFFVQSLHFQHPEILYLAFVLSVASTWYEQLLSMLQSLHRFTQAVVVNGLQSSTKMLGAVLLLIFNFHAVVPIFVGYMLAPLIPLVLSPLLFPKWVKLSLRGEFSAEKRAVLAMAKHSSVAFIAAGLIENIDLLFVQRYLTADETGLLAGVSRIAMMITLVAYSLGNVLYPRVARYKEKQHLEKYLKKAGVLALSAIAGFVAFLPFARWAIFFTIGEKYLGGVGILYILVAAAFITIAAIPFQALFYTLKADWYFSVSGLVQLLIVVAGNLVFVPEYGLEASAWTKLASRVFLFGFSVIVGVWLYGRQYRQNHNVQK